MTRRLAIIAVAIETICLIILLMLIATPKEVFTKHIEIVIK